MRFDLRIGIQSETKPSSGTPEKTTTFDLSPDFSNNGFMDCNAHFSFLDDSLCTPGLPFVDYPVPLDMAVELFPTLRYLLYYTGPDLVPLVNSNVSSDLSFLSFQLTRLHPQNNVAYHSLFLGAVFLAARVSEGDLRVLLDHNEAGKSIPP